MKNVFIAFVGLFAIAVPIACSNNTDNAEALTEEIDAGSFTVQVPEEWQLVVDQGIDTYIGRIFNENDTIYFDYGYLSFGGLERVEQDSETISFEPLFINGESAIIVKERRPEDTYNEIRLSAYIDSGDGENLNRLYSYDAKDEALILKIMKSHRFVFTNN